MNVVWPMTALYFGPFAVWLYCRTLPYMTKKDREHEKNDPASQQKISTPKDSPDRTEISVSVFHCGAGCTLGDIIGESPVPALGLVFAGKFGSKLIIDFSLAYLLGIAFQYYTIAPMRGHLAARHRPKQRRPQSFTIRVSSRSMLRHASGAKDWGSGLHP
jgi:hypothetical protein